MQHTEIVMSGVTVYVAPITTAFPVVNAAPAGNWTKLGTSGDVNLGEDGVTISHEQTLNPKRTLGSTGPIKVTRSEENLTVAGVLIDLTLEQYAKVLNRCTVTDTPADDGVAGIRTIPLRQGVTVATFAVVVRGEYASPYGETFNIQYEIPVMYQSENPAPVFAKGDSANLSFTFTALEDAATPATPFGKAVFQDALPT